MINEKQIDVLKEMRAFAAEMTAVEPRLTVEIESIHGAPEEIICFDGEKIGHSFQYYDDKHTYFPISDVVSDVLSEIVTPLPKLSSPACKAALDFMWQKGVIIGHNRLTWKKIKSELTMASVA